MEERRKNYRMWDPQQCCQIPVSPRQALPEDDLVFFLLDLMPQLNLSPFHQHYAQEMRGQPPFDRQTDSRETCAECSAPSYR